MLVAIGCGSGSLNGSYRYGFNGKENDNEVKGTGNQQDYGMRIYDPRLGKFLSVDPIMKDYPMLTPYQFASNNPILSIDLDGAEAKPTNKGTQEGVSQITSEVSYATLHNIPKETKTTWYWHSGGLKNGVDKKTQKPTHTQAGWYTSESYMTALSSTYAAKALASDLNLYSGAAEANKKTYLNEGRSELEKYAGNGINSNAASHLLSAAKKQAGLSNLSVSGVSYQSQVNIEDLVGLGIFFKQGVKALSSMGGNTIYRVVSAGEAEDVLKMGFRQPPLSLQISTYEGKLFWPSSESARWFKSWVGKESTILKVKVDKGFIFENGTDVGRLFYYVSPERLEKLNSAIKSVNLSK